MYIFCQYAPTTMLGPSIFRIFYIASYRSLLGLGESSVLGQEDHRQQEDLHPSGVLEKAAPFEDSNWLNWKQTKHDMTFFNVLFWF